MDEESRGEGGRKNGEGCNEVVSLKSYSIYVHSSIKLCFCI